MSVLRFSNYLALEKKYSPHTILAYQKDLQSFLDFIKNQYDCKQPVEVNYSMIRSWIVMLVDNGINNKSINRKVASLKAYFKYLLKTGNIIENPLVRHKSLKVAKTMQVPFSEKEINNVLSSFDNKIDFISLRDKAIVELFYSTGIRKSELINIRLNDLSLENQIIKVLGKRNKERLIPLLPSVAGTLNVYINLRSGLNNENKSESLFLTQKGVKVNQTLVYRIINNYFSKVSSKVKKSPHILRHSFATHLLNEGAELNAVKELLGHASLASTQVYTHNSISELKKVYANTHPRNK